MSILDQVNSIQDLKKLSLDQLPDLSEDIRQLIIEVTTNNGGHLASSLGVVELIIALHYVFNCPDDKLIWDVGHQAYAHKILTGRKEQFNSIRTYGGLSGFPNIFENEHDAFTVGHSSTSISAGLGFAVSREFLKQNNKVIAVIGDGSLTAGMAFEGLNNAGAANKDLIVVLNDNKISISKNVGAISHYLTEVISFPGYNKMKDEIWQLMERIDFAKEIIRPLISKFDEGLKNMFVPGLLFEKLGFRYFGPIDGHNLPLLVHTFENLKKLRGPIFVHVVTTKGKGYSNAEANVEKYHGVSGKINKQKKTLPPTYTQVFGSTITKLGEMNSNIIAITAAMGHHGGFAEFEHRFPERFFDVGIAEQHAVTFAGALGIQKPIKPVVMMYNTFLQRAYDSLVHDVALQKSNVLFAVDRTGLVGADGPTHHGQFGFSFLRVVPDLVIAVPRDENMLQHLLYTGVEYFHGPFAVLYPRGAGEGVPIEESFKELPIGKAEVLNEGKHLLIIAAGTMARSALIVTEMLRTLNIEATVIDLIYLKPLDEELLINYLSSKPARNLVLMEENSMIGGVSSAILELIADHEIKTDKILRIGIGDEFVTHGAKKELFNELQLLPEQIFNRIIKKFFPRKIKKIS